MRQFCGLFVVVAVLFGSLSAWADAWDAPVGYYDAATGSGSVLETQLYDIMSAGHVEQRYGDFRFSAVITDADPNAPGNILLGYSRASVSATWDSGSTWNREHTWPQSRQPGSASNSTRGNLGDPHALRPLNPGTNSSRGNKPFGHADTTGVFRAVTGGSYFPGDADRGDTARQLFYSDTRYGPETGIALVAGAPGSNQMGDLDTLIAWHYLDTPDDFERRRNHTIYSQAENPSYYTNNRNAYIDRPEYVWSAFVDNFNDTKLTLAGGSPAANGASSLALDFGSVIVGAAIPASQAVTLNKTGQAGTYYSVTGSAGVTTSLGGRFNAFATGGPGSVGIDIGVQGSTASPGTLGGTVTFDNLDVTTGLGSGFGALDGNDTVTASLNVLGHANASFASSGDVNALTLDFGQVASSNAVSTLNFSVFNDDSVAGLFTAGLDLDSVTGTGDTSVLTTDLAAFESLGAGLDAAFTALVDLATIGVFSATYTIHSSDQDLDGATSGSDLILTLLAEVIEQTSIGDYDNSGVIGQADLDLVLLNWGTTGTPDGWVNQVPTGVIAQAELDDVLLNWASGVEPSFAASSSSVPEPATAAMLVMSGLVLAYRRERGTSLRTN